MDLDISLAGRILQLSLSLSSHAGHSSSPGNQEYAPGPDKKRKSKDNTGRVRGPRT